MNINLARADKKVAELITKYWLVVTVALLLMPVGAGKLYAQQVYYYGSVQYATGSYIFDKTTRNVYLNNGFSLSEPRYDFSFSYPFVIQNYPWISHTGYGSIPTGGPQHGAVDQHNGMGSGHGNGRRTNIHLPDTAHYVHSAFGDPIMSGGYRLFKPSAGQTTVMTNVSVKLPLASPSSGFGTGAWDVGAGGTLSQRLGSWFLTGSATYWVFGDMPDLSLKNGLSYNAGIGKTLSRGGWMILGNVSGMTSIIEGTNPPVTAGLGIGLRLTEKVLFSTNFTAGLTSSSSDFTLGTGWQIRL